jgi:hypothetical protein
MYKKNWEVEIEFRVGGGGRTGAEGFAVWLVDNTKVVRCKRSGGVLTSSSLPTQSDDRSVFGAPNYWAGLGIIFDSFDNDGQRDNPSIRAVLNDGTKAFDHNSDGRIGDSIGSCTSIYRNPYLDGKMSVEIDALFTGTYVTCIPPTTVDVPSELLSLCAVCCVMCALVASMRWGITAKTGPLYGKTRDRSRWCA